MAIIKTAHHETLVDDALFEYLNQFKWHSVFGWGGQPTIKRWLPGIKPRKAISLHHDVLGVDPATLNGKVIDHINRNPLDNRKENLRIVNKSENALNSLRAMKAKSVYYEKAKDRWKAFLLMPYGKRLYLGSFKTEAEAVIAHEQVWL